MFFNVDVPTTRGTSHRALHSSFDEFGVISYTVGYTTSHWHCEITGMQTWWLMAYQVYESAVDTIYPLYNSIWDVL